MDILNNLDLLSVGVAIAGIGILGFVVYFNNRESVTNRSFLYFSIITILWGIVNYLSYQFSDEDTVLWLLRFIMFFAVFQAFFLYRLFHVFPDKVSHFSKKHKYILIPITLLTAVMTLTPYLFSNIIGTLEIGEVAQVQKGFGILLFAVVSVGLVIRGLYLLLKKERRTSKDERKPFTLILTGTFIMFALIIAFNFILPIFFNKPQYTPLGALFIFPFVAFTSYAILKHKLFNIKVAATATLVFILSVVIFLEIIFAETLVDVLMKSGVFILVLIFGIILIRGVRKEVVLREEVQELAKELGKANVRLRELDKQKSEFMSFATHQIRAPLTAMKGYASLVLEGTFGEVSDKVKGAVEKIFKSSDSLVIMVEDFLNVSRIEQGGMKYEFSVVDVGGLVDETVATLSANVEKAGLQISVDKKDREDYKVKADIGKLRQVITNLIDNAIKYTPKGSIKIALTKDKKKKKIRIAFSDTGVGIKKETLPKLFEKFTRAKGAGRVNAQGSGLGLYLAKKIAEGHKGKIWAESDGEGKGATFFVELAMV